GKYARRAGTNVAALASVQHDTTRSDGHRASPVSRPARSSARRISRARARGRRATYASRSRSSASIKSVRKLGFHTETRPRERVERGPGPDVDVANARDVAGHGEHAPERPARDRPEVLAVVLEADAQAAFGALGLARRGRHRPVRRRAEQARMAPVHARDPRA